MLGLASLSDRWRNRNPDGEIRHAVFATPAGQIRLWGGAGGIKAPCTGCGEPEAKPDTADVPLRRIRNEGNAVTALSLAS